VFEKQKSTVSASRVPTIRRGLSPRGAERVDGGALRALDLASDDAEFGHHLSSRPRVLRHAETRIEPWTS